MKKINLGLLAILITVMSLMCYIAIGEITISKDKEEIKKISIEYLKIHNKYSVLEEKYRDINNNIPTAEYEKYLADMKNELSQYVLAENLQDIYDAYKAKLDNQITGKYIVKKYNRELQDVSRYNFELPLVTINLDLILNLETEDRINAIKDENTNKYVGEVSLDTKTDRLTDTIVFKKVDGKYKIIYHKVATNNFSNSPFSYGVKVGE
jgi:hypothetical protein